MYQQKQFDPDYDDKDENLEDYITLSEHDNQIHENLLYEL